MQVEAETKLETRETLETLITAMNNLVAQQKGLNATSGYAVKYGMEQERASALANE